MTIFSTPTQTFLLITKVSILLDVAKGLAYLHNRKPVVIQGDLILAAMIILLSSEGVAKILHIVDIDVDPACTSGFLNTIQIPSTFVYEAISKFDRKLDVFSFGHIALREIEFGYKRERLQSGTTK